MERARHLRIVRPHEIETYVAENPDSIIVHHDYEPANLKTVTRMIRAADNAPDSWNDSMFAAIVSLREEINDPIIDSYGMSTKIINWNIPGLRGFHFKLGGSTRCFTLICYVEDKMDETRFQAALTTYFKDKVSYLSHQ